MEPDFSGYATKAGLKCADGRTITAEAFKHMDGLQVPLVWQHDHQSPSNVLGHAVLEARPDGMYAHGFFNDTPAGQTAKALVMHKDVNKMSIWANQLVEKAKTVLHGMIREVSLVLSGANPGALIDYVRISHGDGEFEDLTDEAVIYTGLELVHGDVKVPVQKTAETEETDETVETDETAETVEHATVREVYDSLSEEQKNVVHFMIGAALEAAGDNAAEHSDSQSGGNGDLNTKEGTQEMTRNVFEGNAKPAGAEHVLSHSDVKEIVASAVKGGSLKEAVQEYALKHGIENIDVLFPDAKAIASAPEFDKRRTEWVAGVLNGARKTPFARIKSLTADLTFDEARAKGYIKGEFKKEEFFAVSKRVTTPTTIYKKQKLDRDDIIDITDFDVVAWLKGEMRLMLDEELARAALIGDGRAVDDEDKIKDPVGASEGAGIRSIVNDHELYVTTVNVNLEDATSSYNEMVEAILRARRFYKGTGSPTLYTTEAVLVEMLLAKDTTGRRLYQNKSELVGALMVNDIVAVEVMENQGTLLGVLVNMADYTFGADRGGDVAMFDDFDIDYNQYKYLLETRVSGGLTKIKSAVVLRSTTSTNVLATPTEPAFVASTGVVTIPTVTGVVYKDTTAGGATLSAGAQAALDAGESWHIVAVPASGYYFFSNAEDEWDFTRDEA